MNDLHLTLQAGIAQFLVPALFLTALSFETQSREIMPTLLPIFTEIRVSDSLDWQIEIDAADIPQTWYINRSAEYCSQCTVSCFGIKTARKKSMYYLSVPLNENRLGVCSASNVIATDGEVAPCIYPDIDACSLFVVYTYTDRPRPEQQLVYCGSVLLRDIKPTESMVACPQFFQFIKTARSTIGFPNQDHNTFILFVHNGHYAPVQGAILVNGQPLAANGRISFRIEQCASLGIDLQSLGWDAAFNTGSSFSVSFDPNCDTIYRDVGAFEQTSNIILNGNHNSLSGSSKYVLQNNRTLLPTEDHLNYEAIAISIFDISGRTLFQKPYSEFPNRGIDLKALLNSRTGHYLIRVSTSRTTDYFKAIITH